MDEGATSVDCAESHYKDLAREEVTW